LVDHDSGNHSVQESRFGAGPPHRTPVRFAPDALAMPSERNRLRLNRDIAL
jgi:hypothetical protein